jgi:hypothetical protein
MPLAYPLGLRTILRPSKSRTQPASFSTAEPRRGYAYVQETGTDTPVFWDVEFRFTTQEALIFRLWFTQSIRRGVDEFTMPIRTEFGVQTYTCRFMPDNLMPASEDGETWRYSATIMARAELIPEVYVEAADLIVYLPDWQSYAEMLDMAMTQEMPED